MTSNTSSLWCQLLTKNLLLMVSNTHGEDDQAFKKNAYSFQLLMKPTWRGMNFEILPELTNKV